MRIIHLIHKKQNRGAETFACQLSNHLLHLGHEVKIISIYGGEAILPFKGEITSLKASSSTGYFNLSVGKALKKIIQDYKPDLIQTNAGDTLKYAVLSKIFFGWKEPIVVRNASEVGQYLRSPIQKYLNALFYKNVAKVISVSKASEEDILKIFPFLQGKTEVVPVGLEEIRCIPKKEFQPVFNKHIIHVGGFSFEKNHLGLIRIFQKVLEKDLNIHLHLIGDGALRNEIEYEVEIRNLSKYVTFYGFVNNPLTFIKAANVLVLPSIIEGLPGVLLEAMYCKTPVIAYNVGGISEIVTTETGQLIDKNDEEAFSLAISRILKKKEDIQLQAANEMVQKDFMNSQIALKFLVAYKNTIHKNLLF